jgi:hypothetical protein
MSLVSGVGMTVCMLGLAAYLQIVPNGSTTALSNPQLSTVPLVLLLVYVVRQTVHTRTHTHTQHAQHCNCTTFTFCQQVHSVSVQQVAGAIGFHTLPWAMLGEMYPSHIKGLAGGLTTCLAYLFSFAALKMYPSLLLLLGGDATNPRASSSEGVFYLYGVVSLVATLFVALFLTETHRKTLQQVEQEFVTRPLMRRVALWRTQ